MYTTKEKKSKTLSKKKHTPSLKKGVCLLCKSDKGTRLFYDYGDFSYVKCVNCGFVFQSPKPSLEEIYNIYSSNYFEYEIENQDVFFNLMRLSLLDINFKELTRGLSERRILDIGCATGLLLNSLKNEGWDTYGAEICELSANYAREEFGLNVKNKPLEECNFPDEFFDVVHLSHLIEHVSNPSLLLDEIYRIMKKGAYAIITTPDVSGLFAKLLRSTWRSSIKEHLFLFSKKTLSLLIKQKGFNIIKKVSWGSIPIERSRFKLIKRFTDTLVKKANIGDVVLILAQKK